MSPKTNQMSSSKHQGGGACSSSLDLYNKTHDFVLSRTPDQSRTSIYLHHVMRMVISQISLEIGWNTAHLSALDTLSDLCIRYLLQIAKQSKKYTEHYGRTLVNEDDVSLGLQDMNISVSELEEYIQNFEPVAISKDVPFFPVPRKTDLNFLRPGSSEVLVRPVHVHEYMPPMKFEQSEDGDSERFKENEGDASSRNIKTEVSDETILTDEQLANGMMPLILEEPSQVPEVAAELVVVENQVTEEIELKTENAENEDPTMAGLSGESLLQPGTLNDIKNDLEDSSDDDIEPAASKAASIFATFKSTKKLESASENAALKRIRRMLEEQGHPVREVSSVIMTSSGFLSESREGRLPDNRPPVIREYVEDSPPPERKIKIPTMKKILEGVRKVEKSRSDSEDGIEEGPGLFGEMDKIVTLSSGGQNKDALDIVSGDNVMIPEELKISKKKLSKQEKKLLQKHKKSLKEKKLKTKKDKLVKHAKSNLQATAVKEAMEPPGGGTLNKNKLMIFKKPKQSKLDGSSSSSSTKKKKKDKKNRLKLKDVKLPSPPPPNYEEEIPYEPIIKEDPVPPAGTELIESDEDFSTPVEEPRVIPPMHIIAAPPQFPREPMPPVPRKKLKKVVSAKLNTPIFDFHQISSKKLLKAAKAGVVPAVSHPIPKTKLPNLKKRPLMDVDGLDGDDGLPIKKKRGRPKKVWGETNVLPTPSSSMGASPTGGPGSLHPSQLASIGKSLMVKEPTLKIMKIRKEHMEVQDLTPGPTPSFTTTKTPTISPNKSSPGSSGGGSGGSSIVSADLLKRLPAQPGLIPIVDPNAAAPSVRLPKDLPLPASISITPAALSSPQKEMGSGGSRGFPGGNLPPNVCSSVTITRIDMSNQQKLPSPYDDSITPGIGPPPGLEGPHKRSKLTKGVPRPPPLQPQILAETESGITITPIMMGMGGHKEHRYDEPLPPPPPLQARPQPKHSMLAKLDEELSSGSSASTSVSTSKEQRKKDKEKRKELKKEKKKKAKDKSRDKSEKKKKKKDKSPGESSSSVHPSGGSTETLDITTQATVPKLTLKLSGHSNTPTPVDSPNPPPVFHDPTPTIVPRKLSFKGFLEDTPPKPPKQRSSVPVPAPIPQEEEDLEVARFAPLVTRPIKPSRAAKAHAVAGIAAVSIGATYSQQEIVQFPSSRDRSDKSRGRGRPPKGGATTPVPEVAKGASQPSTSKQAKSSVTVLETETVGCIIDDEGNKVWICPACGRQDDGSPMIGCDQCDDWYHFPCVGITEEPSEDDQWFCQRCIRKKSHTGKSKKKK